MNLLWNGIPPNLIKLITCTLFLWLPRYITCYMLSRQWIYEKYNDKDNEKEKEDNNHHDIDNDWGHLLNLAPGALCVACGAIGYPNPTSSCRPMESGLGKLFAFISGVTSKNQWKHNTRDDLTMMSQSHWALSGQPRDGRELNCRPLTVHWRSSCKDGTVTWRCQCMQFGPPVHSLELAIYTPLERCVSWCFSKYWGKVKDSDFHLQHHWYQLILCYFSGCVWRRLLWISSKAAVASDQLCYWGCCAKVVLTVAVGCEHRLFRNATAKALCEARWGRTKIEHLCRSGCFPLQVDMQSSWGQFSRSFCGILKVGLYL